MTLVHAPPFRWRPLLLAASLAACGPSSSSAPVPVPEIDSAAPGDGAVAGDDAEGDAPAESPDADDCAGVRCAAPLPCGQACTSRCCCNPACPADAGADGATPGVDAATSDAGGSCANAGDCRLFSDYCGGCTCVPLATSEADPICTGGQTSCLVAPCNGKSATCAGGHCALAP